MRPALGSAPRCQSSAPPLSARCGRPNRDSTLAPSLRTSCVDVPSRVSRAEAISVPEATPSSGGRPSRRGRSTRAFSASHPGNGSSSASRPSGSAVPTSAAQRWSTAEQRPAAPAPRARATTWCQSIRPPRATMSTSTSRPRRRAPSRPPLMHRWTKVSTGSRVATRTFGASSTVSARSKSGAMSQRISRRVVPSATRSQCRSMAVAPAAIGISATPWSRKPFQLAECSANPASRSACRQRAKSCRRTSTSMSENWRRLGSPYHTAPSTGPFTTRNDSPRAAVIAARAW